MAFCQWYREYYDLQPGNKVAAYASYGFDAHMMDIYPALTAGAAVCIIDQSIRLDLNELNRYFMEQKVTHAFMTTQIGRAFATSMQCENLRHLSMSGAAIFIFVMGIGTVYSRNAAPAELAKSGIRMVFYQYLNNMAYVAALLIPYPFVRGNLSETGMGNFKFLIEIYIQYTNIFFITGIIYLVLALFKKLDIKRRHAPKAGLLAEIAGYVTAGVAVSIAAPFLYGKPVNVPVLGYMIKLLIGEADFVSFTPLYFLSYALFGVAFGKILRHVKDKAGFYKILAIPSTLAVIIWWVLIFGKYGSDISEMRAVLVDGYTQPDFWHVMASMAHIFVFAIIFFFIGRSGRKDGKTCEPKNPIARQLLYYSRHISKYYALHVTVYFIALGIHGYESFKSYQCWLLALLSMIVTELMVRGYNAKRC